MTSTLIYDLLYAIQTVIIFVFDVRVKVELVISAFLTFATDYNLNMNTCLKKDKT